MYRGLKKIIISMPVLVGNVRWPRRMLPHGKSRWVYDARSIKVRKKTGHSIDVRKKDKTERERRTDASPLHYAHR